MNCLTNFKKGDFVSYVKLDYNELTGVLEAQTKYGIVTDELKWRATPRNRKMLMIASDDGTNFVDISQEETSFIPILISTIDNCL